MTLYIYIYLLNIYMTSNIYDLQSSNDEVIIDTNVSPEEFGLDNYTDQVYENDYQLDYTYTLLYENIDLGINSSKNILNLLKILILLGQNKKMIMERLSNILDETDIVHASNPLIVRTSALRDIINQDADRPSAIAAAAELKSIDTNELARQYDIDHAEEHAAIKEAKRINIYRIINEYFDKASVLVKIQEKTPNQINEMLSNVKSKILETKRREKLYGSSPPSFTRKLKHSPVTSIGRNLSVSKSSNRPWRGGKKTKKYKKSKKRYNKTYKRNKKNRKYKSYRK